MPANQADEKGFRVCTDCGTVHVNTEGCPVCALRKRVDRAERDIDIIDGGY